MSFTSTYAQKPPNYKGVGMAVGVHALIIAGIMAMPGIDLPGKLPTVIETYDVKVKPEPIEVPPEPKDVQVETPMKAQDTVKVTPMVKPPIFNDPPAQAFNTVENGIDFGGLGDRTEIPVTPVEAIPDPVIADARLNTRYSSQFQPPYPSGLLRMGEEGMITVRVLVGTDGRAKQIELIDSPHEGFWTATKRHALKKWRFEPATKDGAAFESWITLKVRFEINS
ncbi:energy transducer TonB [Parasphingorhabdus cellanae]|uniref:Energy transducer TonB n=1 Tax=Parasphingorhabdus cellanae TaxID=2806553 RepID=A0ABX7SZW3_9SPHN|nr:energy transducer TonB [Parasphingorhabdus cellanae]QTD54833.1 energy transducer TonB [Parasphingorhabdus cellanae]